MTLATVFRPNSERYDGVRPIQVHLLRLGYVLVFVFVGYRSWFLLINHQGDWDPVVAAAIAMWASSSLLSLIGAFRPLEMLPLVLFEIGYKLIWLIFVTWPLWSANRLAGSRAEEMTSAFLPVVVPILLVPWGHVFRRYVWSQPQGEMERTVTFG